MKATINRFAVLVLSVAVLGCAGRAVSRDELIGAWLATTDSRERLPDHIQRGRLTLVLKAEGTFQATEMPRDMVYLGQLGQSRFVNGSGRWQLDGASGNQMVTFNFLQLDDGGQEKSPYRIKMFVAVKRDGLYICYIRGDPDDWNLLCFEKKDRE